MRVNIRPSDTENALATMIEISDWIYPKFDRIYLTIKSPGNDKYLTKEGWLNSRQKNLVYCNYSSESICNVSIESSITDRLIFANNYEFCLFDLNDNEIFRFGRAWRGLPVAKVPENLSDLADATIELSKAKGNLEVSEVSIDIDISNKSKNFSFPDNIVANGSFEARPTPTQISSQGPAFSSSDMNLTSNRKILLVCRNRDCGGEFFAEDGSSNDVVCKWCGSSY